MITLEKVKKTFTAKGTSFDAVTNINLTINKGEIFGIVGYSGAGKSTLIRMLNGLELPTSGSIIIDNKEFSKLKKKEIRKERQSIGMIFQHFHLLWSRTVLENVLFPLEIAHVEKEERHKRAKELIRMNGFFTLI